MAETESDGIRFRTKLEGPVVDQIRALYFRRNPLFPVAYGAGAVMMVWLAVRQERELWDRITLLVPAGLLALAAACLPLFHWRAWWPQFVARFKDGYSGTVFETEVVVNGFEEQIPWSAAVAKKQAEGLVLLYLSRTEALPLSRTMLESDQQWITVLDWIGLKETK